MNWEGIGKEIKRERKGILNIELESSNFYNVYNPLILI